MTSYNIPEVWINTTNPSALNQDKAGSRFQQKLPKGEAIFQLYTLATPNGIKPIILLEELKEAGILTVDYDLFKIDITKGQQFGSDFVAINPNSKIPAMIDQSNQDLAVFESANILLYLAEKYHFLLGENLKERTQILNWLFWQTGAAPFLGGGFGHFFHYAPEKLEYPIDRYTMETKRQLDLLDKELSSKAYICGDSYSIADIAIWSWYGQLVLDRLYPNAAVFLDSDRYQAVKRWANHILERPAVQRALAASYQSIT
ncbi:glutathione-dependent disulfide-bond oxidoreductase [Streptococcus iniae]|uniref:glutathione-dependent disulfide-bond oxidoreductase n=1 Tax=Streptococcus iniae TaxID=1346 RepID=UPI0008DAF911|nr:glutathione-dependent disulfide-bond oxidoreductase [Streptococcus iniae]OHX28137.1 glutathione-dependent disulfide-bond oxidoreductase [Streptococcus iniae]RLV27633.1 glutathione-dependent disulfide-bond oxidoreductase [Streptococcus iniae]